jgi:hypothetical protein
MTITITETREKMAGESDFDYKMRIRHMDHSPRVIETEQPKAEPPKSIYHDDRPGPLDGMRIVHDTPRHLDIDSPPLDSKALKLLVEPIRPVKAKIKNIRDDARRSVPSAILLKKESLRKFLSEMRSLEKQGYIADVDSSIIRRTPNGLYNIPEMEMIKSDKLYESECLAAENEAESEYRESIVTLEAERIEKLATVGEGLELQEQEAAIKRRVMDAAAKL